MDPFLGLSSLPAWGTALLLLGLTLIAALAPLLIRRRISLERLVLNNEVAGFKYATLGVTYAVLLGFVVITVWEEYNAAEALVYRESSVLDAMYQLGERLPDDVGAPILEEIRVYLDAVVTDEWSAMQATGSASVEVTDALRQLYQKYLSVQPANQLQTTLLDKSLDQLILLNEIRRERLDTADGKLPPVLGVTLIVGALLTIGFTLFFGAPNVGAQAAMTGILCLMVMLVLFAAIMLNAPFSGRVYVEPQSLEELRQQIEVGPTPSG